MFVFIICSFVLTIFTSHSALEQQKSRDSYYYYYYYYYCYLSEYKFSDNQNHCTVTSS